ncbi:MAG: hypothetical protein JXA60_03585 [Candidatus Coatesbacteria bacterium]|nr:hypothetical protein [Candidatus Coatesbacteria bacterium]
MNFEKPATLISKKGNTGLIKLDDDIIEMDISSVPEAKIGDYLLIKEGKVVCIYEYDDIKNSYAKNMSSIETDSEIG